MDGIQISGFKALGCEIKIKIESKCPRRSYFSSQGVTNIVIYNRYAGQLVKPEENPGFLDITFTTQKNIESLKVSGIVRCKQSPNNLSYVIYVNHHPLLGVAKT